VFRNASIDSLSFKRPTKVGDVLIVRGYVSRVWKSSLEVYISVHTATTSYNDAWNKQVLSIEDAVDHDNSFEFTNDGYMTFVALQGGNEEETTSLDESHPSLKFIELPPIKPLTDIEIWRHETAITRREARLSGRQQLTGESHQTSIEIAP
jgi:acyl-CoA hydrolase